MIGFLRKILNELFSTKEDTVYEDYKRRHALADYHDPVCVKERELEKFIKEEVLKDAQKH